MARLEIKGLDKLEAALKENVTMNDVKRVVRYNGSQMHQKIQANADFSKGYQKGTTKRSIKLEFPDGGFTAEVKPGTHYSPYLEYGTRYMDAQPFVGPGYNAQKGKFKSDMQKLVR
jgi:HK97 gp10 family phage protein